MRVLIPDDSDGYFERDRDGSDLLDLLRPWAGAAGDDLPAHPAGPLLESVVDRQTAELTELYNELRAVHDELADFVAGPDDPGTPLGAILRSAEALGRAAEAADPGVATGELGRIVSTVEEVRLFLSGLPSSFRLGSAPERRLPVDLAEIVDGLRPELAPVSVTVQPGLPFVSGDPSALRVLFRHLLTRLAGSPGGANGPAVHLGATREPAGWVLSIAGDGAPSDPGLRRQIFNLLRGIDVGGEAPGTARSLVACRRIIRAHGGDFWAEDTGAGSVRFCFTLPEADHTAPATATTTATPPAAPATASQAQRVILVEDDDAWARLVEQMLRRALGDGGVEVQRFATMGAVSATLAQSWATSALVDLGLPDGQGLEVVDAVRALNPLLPVVVLTGRADDELATAALGAGAQDYLVKDGLTGDALVRSLRFAIERAGHGAELSAATLRDPLTGLSNRVLLEDRLELALRRAERRPEWVGLVFLDLDGFKPVNDTYGHLAGDMVLRAVAARLEAAVRPSDTVARLGGDEFVILCDELPDAAAAEAILSRIHDGVSRPVDIGDGRAVTPRVSAGIALARPDDSMQSLLRRADEEMYRVKRQSRRA